MILDPVEFVEEYVQEFTRENIGPNSYDLRIDRVFEIDGGLVIRADGSRDLPPYTFVDFNDEGFVTLKPHRVYQIETLESITLPEGVCAITLMRSSMHKSGASGEVGLFDTGYSGKCGMTVSVHNECTVQKRSSLFQLLFLEAQSSRLYNGVYRSPEWIDRLTDRS